MSDIIVRIEAARASYDSAISIVEQAPLVERKRYRQELIGLLRARRDAVIKILEDVDAETSEEVAP